MRPLAPLLLATAAALVALPTLAAQPASGVDPAALDRSVAPGDDFEAYANGAWRKATTIRPDRAEEGGEREGDHDDHGCKGRRGRRIALILKLEDEHAERLVAGREREWSRCRLM